MNTQITLDQLKALLFSAKSFSEALDILDAHAISYRGEICTVIDSHGVMFWKSRNSRLPICVMIDAEKASETVSQHAAALQSAQALSTEVPSTDSPESIAPLFNSCPQCMSENVETQFTGTENLYFSWCTDCEYDWHHDHQFNVVINPDALSTASVDKPRVDYVKIYIESGLLREMLRNERRLKRSLAEGYQL